MNIFLQAFITLFVVVDPVGTAAVFSSLTRGRGARQALKIAIKATIVASCVLLGFGFLGNWVLHYLGVSIPAFRVAGGLLLFITAFRMLMGGHDAEQIESADSAYGDRSDIAIFPLAIPFLAGPGCMTAVMLNMTKITVFAEKFWVAAAIVIVEILALVCMIFASRLVQLVGASGNSLLARIMGILMAALSVQFVADGANALFIR